MVYQWITLAGTVVCLPLSVVAWRARPKPGAVPLAVLTLAIAEWNLAQFLSIQADSVALTIALTKLHFVGLTLVVPALVVLLLEYAGREDLLTRRTYGLLAIEPVLVNLLLWTNGYHDLFLEYAPLSAVADGELRLTEYAVVGAVPVELGPAFWVHAAYNWLLAFGCLLAVGWLMIRRRDIYRAQLAILAVAILFPLTGSLADNILVVPVRLTEPAFVLTGVLLTVAIVRFDLVDLTPVARKAVLAELSGGVVVLDDENRIVDINPMGRRLLGVGDRSVIGEDIWDALPHAPDAIERYEDTREGEETITIDADEDTRHYHVRVSPIADARGRYLGRVFLINDVTERRERERELERQNEHLDQFASIVSHDLRNPLQVASSSVELAAETDDDAAELERIERSLDRIETIVDDMRTLARQGQTIQSTEPTDLRAVATRAWETVDTGDAHLENDLAGTVTADESRLRQVFENLFRNAVEHGSTSPDSGTRQDAVEHGSTSPQQTGDAVEHGGDTPEPADGEGAIGDGGPPVTVTVGTLGSDDDDVLDPDDGFYVADDGPGIPEAERDSVFEVGYSDREGGTGLGLAIVGTVVEAHGWEVRVTESDAGGARFEVTGVEFTDE